MYSLETENLEINKEQRALTIIGVILYFILVGISVLICIATYCLFNGSSWIGVGVPSGEYAVYILAGPICAVFYGIFSYIFTRQIVVPQTVYWILIATTNHLIHTQCRPEGKYIDQKHVLIFWGISFVFAVITYSIDLFFAKIIKKMIKYNIRQKFISVKDIALYAMWSLCSIGLPALIYVGVVVLRSLIYNVETVASASVLYINIFSIIPITYAAISSYIAKVKKLTFSRFIITLCHTKALKILHTILAIISIILIVISVSC